MIKIKKESLTLQSFILEDKTPIDFIRNFLVVYNKKYRTLLNGLYYCGLDKRRSVEDIYNLTNSYFDGVTVDNVIEILIDLLFENKKELNHIIFGHYCPDIERTVFKAWPKGTYFNGNQHINFFSLYEPYLYEGFNPIFIERIRARLENLK